ncbi:hypothetical protein [Chryseobacterium sp. MDT2-18]|uniref:hypothetical protein n=1 Tax=Chryseobacterium sp. MDT2-18 TaxID=1259136 RepID=UPI00278AA8F6|nr:hypothetical protein [Chryseobacterium sp. MDT2-18]MDQ0477857.1 acetate kinase [Chryseobacterium sp. MDT2-18]
MILSVNGGSSCIKFSLYRIQKPLEQMLFGAIENIGTANTQLSFTVVAEPPKKSWRPGSQNY